MVAGDVAAVGVRVVRFRIGRIRGVASPWVAPGTYTVRLTADGQTATQPIAIKLDPRVKVTPEVQQIFTLTTQLETYARNASAAQKEARALLDKLKTTAASDARITELERIAPMEAPGGGGGGGRGGRGGGRGAIDASGDTPAPTTLSNIGTQLVAAAMAMQGSEMPPTAAELEACRKQEAAYTALMAKWAALKAPKPVAASKP